MHHAMHYVRNDAMHYVTHLRRDGDLVRLEPFLEAAADVHEHRGLESSEHLRTVTVGHQGCNRMVSEL